MTIIQSLSRTVFLSNCKPPGRGCSESADTFQACRGWFAGTAPRLPSRPNITMPAVPSLTWRDLMLFGCTGASIVLALITAAIVVSDMLARGTP